MRRTLDLRSLANPRRLHSGDREILVLDGLFDRRQIKEAHAVLEKLAYIRNDIDGDDTAYARHWKLEFKPAQIADFELFAKIMQRVESIYRAYRCELGRVHCNSHPYGDLQLPHSDVARGEGVTALYFVNASWRREWMGEVIFYDPQGEAQHAVEPKPGRLLLFDGDILHRGGVPSRVCYETRLSLALKFALHRRRTRAQSTPTAR